MSIPIENRVLPVGVASAFGRAFYGSPNRIYFSQIYNDNIESLAKCFQRNDPTDVENPDLLPNDGGEIFIQGAGKIKSLKEYWRGILVFAERGVWFLSGGETNFSALSYRVDKISSTRIISVRSVVDFEGAVYVIGQTGIIRISVNESGQLTADNLTEMTVNKWFDDFIAPVESPFVIEETDGDSILSTVNTMDKEILWYHPLTRKGVIYNVRANAFYPQQYSLDEGGSFCYTRDLGYVQTQTTYTQNLDNLMVRFGCIDCGQFKDYGEPFESYIVTNFNTVGSFGRNKSIPIMSVYFNKTETTVDVDEEGKYVFDKPSGCVFQTLWDWNDTEAGNRHTDTRSIYNPLPKRRGFIKQGEGEESFDTGETVIEFKDKIRGKGRAVQFRFESEEGKDMQLLGYDVNFASRGRKS